MLLILLGGFGAILGLIYYLQTRNNQPLIKEEQLEQLINSVYGKSAHQIAQQSQQLLQSERETIQTDLSNKQHSIEQIVSKLHEEIVERQKEIRSLEQDRQKSFAAVREAIQQHQLITKDLQATTQTLAKVLTNNQQRGEWGEHIIEDLLRSSGLVEGIHYVRQQQLGNGVDRPDIALILPEDRRVPVDVKFPFSEIHKLATADTKALRDIHKKQFALDVKAKIKKVAQYIRPDDNTLDYAVLFVPNEMVFSFINQEFPEIIADAMRQKVMIVSPFTFLIVARTIFESYRNFMMETNLRAVIQQISEFAKEWERFILEFDKFGGTIDRMSDAYRQIRDTRNKQLSNRMQKIEQLHVAHQLPSPHGQEE